MSAIGATKRWNEVRANVVYRSFCRIGMEKVPDAKTLVRLGRAVGPETISELHDRLVAIAQARKVIRGGKMRVDTTVVESNIHYSTDSGLLDDGARVLTWTMQKVERKAGGLKRQIRNRKRSITKRVIAIAHALRHKGPVGEEKRKREYKELLHTTRRILGDTRKVLEEAAVFRGDVEMRYAAYGSIFRLWRIESVEWSSKPKRESSEACPNPRRRS